MEKIIYSSVFLMYLCLQAFTSSKAEPTDFLSIDCGATSPYKDSQLGIKWETDDKYIKTGKTRQMREGPDFPKQLYSYRYFPSPRSKHCYVLPVRTETTYLLRVRLFPGFRGTSSVDLPVDFNVTFINNLFFSYSANTDTDRVDALYESVFYSFEREEIYLCLVPGTKGTPFINSIELRGLPDTSYRITRSSEVPQFMLLGGRFSMGPKPANRFFRYPDDEFDRFWWAAGPPSFPNFTTFTVDKSFIKNLSFVPYYSNSGVDGYNWPPDKALTDAWIGPNLAFQIKRSRVDTNKVYFAFYFMEIRPEVIKNLSDSNWWEIITYAVDDTSQDYVSISYNDPAYTAPLEEVVLDDNVINVNVSRNSSSAVDGVILNAFEYYYSYDFNISATISRDKIALHELQESFGLQDWQGDPCFPVAWDWLTCDYSEIQKLKLSHMNISGPIPANISNLVDVTEIYLDNNNLEGTIPKSLVSLPKLRRLALDNNKLTGEIPIEFQNKEGFTFTGNPGLYVTRPGTNAPVPGPLTSPPSAAAKSIRRADVPFLAMIFLASLSVIVSFKNGFL
ncbi:hypothetical protein R1sor_002466 [Riccia sorocarpa]|uniref:Malectin-like domain-containing protein n=1 Tax=Riccia sorocarpa TaxID=122646 RepID=A0ABD3H2U8_9MARC